MLLQNKNKIFVLDTNVVLYDYRSIYSFEEHNVVIPITLLEEIDKFKRGNEIINYNAREFSRELDMLIGEDLLSEGATLETGGSIIVRTDVNGDEHLKSIFWEDCPDHRILALAYNLAKEQGSERVFLVSKDINLRMKAKSVGIHAEDYETGKIKDIDDLYTGKNVIEGIPSELVDRLFKEGSVPESEIIPELSPEPNEYFIVRNCSKSSLAVYDKAGSSMRLVEKRRAYGILPRNAEQTFAINALLNDDIKLVTLSGKSGTGKTLMALAAAMECRKEFKQILLARPIIPLSNREIGFLP